MELLQDQSSQEESEQNIIENFSKLKLKSSGS